MIWKNVKLSCLLVSILAMIFVAYFEVSQRIATNRNLSFSSVAGQQQPTPQPETIVLAEKAPLGKVTFNHLNHTSRNYNIEGTRPVYCIECHHVEQPVAEAKKLPPHQTSYPPDRTTTLTAELLAKEPGTNVTPCRGCHARKEEKPLLWPAIPEIKSENSTAIMTMTNQQAFHRACAGCHDQVVKTRPEAKAPGTSKCTSCHKKG
jgi:nitrate/TMAO reductase-like tetraheme cytochrome c subunit